MSYPCPDATKTCMWFMWKSEAEATSTQCSGYSGRSTLWGSQLHGCNKCIELNLAVSASDFPVHHVKVIGRKVDVGTGFMYISHSHHPFRHRTGIGLVHQLEIWGLLVHCVFIFLIRTEVITTMVFPNDWLILKQKRTQLWNWHCHGQKLFCPACAI